MSQERIDQLRRKLKGKRWSFFCPKPKTRKWAQFKTRVGFYMGLPALVLIHKDHILALKRLEPKHLDYNANISTILTTSNPEIRKMLTLNARYFDSELPQHRLTINSLRDSIVLDDLIIPEGEE